MTKITEALDILKQFNVPKKQQNERSALALLALLSLKEKESWKDSKKILIRIHDIMRFIKVQYKRKYAENSSLSIISKAFKKLHYISNPELRFESVLFKNHYV